MVDFHGFSFFRNYHLNQCTFCYRVWCFLRFIDLHMQLFLTVAKHRYRSSLFQTIRRAIEEPGTQVVSFAPWSQKRDLPQDRAQSQCRCFDRPSGSQPSHSESSLRKFISNDIDLSTRTETDLFRWIPIQEWNDVWAASTGQSRWPGCPGQPLKALTSAPPLNIGLLSLQNQETTSYHKIVYSANLPWLQQACAQGPLW